MEDQNPKINEQIVEPLSLEDEERHCLFFGYKTERISPIFITLRSEAAGNLWWWWLSKQDDGILAQRIMKVLNQNSSRIDCLEFVNKFNVVCQVVTAKLFYQKDEELEVVFSAIILGEYNLSNFSTFLQLINHEMSKITSNPNVYESWKKICDTSDAEI
jgi:hypothetical protein